MSTLAELNGHARPSDYAFAYLAAGLSPVPVNVDGSKTPRGTWKRFQTQAATEAELATQFLADNVGVGICYGAGSGNAELIDVDEEASYQPWADEVERSAPGLLAKLCIIKTPRPGRHVVYRCEHVEHNQKLAMRLATPEELQDKPGEPTKTKIETRGQGGFAIAPGGDPAAHPSGRPYVHVAGPPLTELSTITVEERGVLFRAARLLNEVVEVEPDEMKVPDAAYYGKNAAQPQAATTTYADPSARTPGDDFNARASWEEILVPHGWTKSHAMGDVQHWTRPGKDQGTSATTGLKSKHGNDLLCVFSTSAHPFPGANGSPCSTHTKFGAYCLLNHNGDFAAAARQLASEGYGDAPQRPGMPNWMPDDERDFGDVPGPTPKTPKRSEPIPPPQPYPVGSLPAELSEFVESAASALDVCPSTIALPALATCAAAIGNARQVRVTPSWSEVCAIFTANIGRSGSRKSPALSAAAGPLNNLDFDCTDAHQESLEQYEEDNARFQIRLKEWRKSPDEPKPEPPAVPIEHRHVASNCTTEKLAVLLKDNPRGLLCLHDELASLLGNMDRYAGGGGKVSGDVPFYLSAYNAQPYRHDRKTSASVFLRRPLLSIAGGCQPSIFNQAMSEENRENGLLARFLLTFPDDRTHKWVDGDRVNSFTYSQLVTDLAELQPAGFDGKKIVPESIGLDDGARGQFKEWFEEIQEERQLAQDLEAAALAKLEGAAARVAMVFHCVRAASEEPVDPFTIDGDTMRSALTVMRWQRGETLRAYRALEANSEVRNRQRLAHWLTDRFGGVVTPRDLQRNKPAKYATADDAEQALNELHASGLGEWKAPANDGKRGRPKREFVVSCPGSPGH
ncbi:hypothetical protein KOR34_45380 [Posidoniimonas corsicana]|uniref:DNA primase/polymerase bifunctional N-terminal domain-containing protein n=1 Tax=Posidoniimonas corsicana TaxID=1938618 RepID=A0A5C5V086_9BACT|nr:DUF3987 domain-containing protein [Posidoniimonas corsicana]TWT31162.1 hypothetical protein KOR34_45380 [Posidoniimonas corsicana]